MIKGFLSRSEGDLRDPTRSVDLNPNGSCQLIGGKVGRGGAAGGAALTS